VWKRSRSSRNPGSLDMAVDVHVLPSMYHLHSLLGPQKMDSWLKRYWTKQKCQHWLGCCHALPKGAVALATLAFHGSNLKRVLVVVADRMWALGVN